MKNSIAKKHPYIRDRLLCVLPILAYVSMQYRVDTMLLNASLIITFLILILILAFSVNYFSAYDFAILFLNIISIIITLNLYSGIGVALNYLNLFLCFMIFNTVEFSEKAIMITRIMMTVGILCFLITSTYSVEWGFISFYDKNGSLINNNTVSLIFVALYIHLSAFLLKRCTKPRIIALFILFAFCFVSVYVLGCRSAMLFFVLYVFLIIFSKKIATRNISIRKLCITFLIISFIFPLLYIFLYNQIGNFEIMGKSMFSGREIVWLEAYKHIQNSPLFGSGTEFIINYGNSATMSTHNMLLGLWKNLGIVPVISFVSFYVLDNGPKIEKNIMISKIAIIIIAFFESFLMDSRLYLLFLLALPGQKHNFNLEKKNFKRLL